jgi:hypothetical protein
LLGGHALVLHHTVENSQKRTGLGPHHSWRKLLNQSWKPTTINKKRTGIGPHLQPARSNLFNDLTPYVRESS